MIVVEILRRSFEQPRPNIERALSAMARDSIKGYVYVEAFDFAAVTATLSSVPGLRHSRHGSLIADLVPIEDYVQLMEMESRRVEPCTWVCVKKKGTYYNDLGFVYDINKEELTAMVLLVPRIPLYSKRKRQGRPAPCLFDKGAVEVTYGADTIKERNWKLLFQNHDYDYGLLDIDFHFYDLSMEPVDPTSYDLTYFRRTRHPAILKAFGVIDQKPYVGDRVRILSGTYRSLCGRLLSINDHDTFTVQADDNDFGVFDVRAWEVSPHFCLGDSVVVHGGDHTGEQGYVVGKDDKTVVIFVWKNSLASVREQGLEVRRCSLAY
jgi:transcription elongation factor SPT5